MKKKQEEMVDDRLRKNRGTIQRESVGLSSGLSRSEGRRLITYRTAGLQNRRFKKRVN